MTPCILQYSQTLDWDLESRKRYTQPLAVESGEFPDTSTIESRMLPLCYENRLVQGHAADAAQFMSVATETFIKEMLSSIFGKTRSNGPGAGGSAGSGGGAGWVTTHKYRRQLEKEEDSLLRGELQRDKSGLLPIEAKAASERGPLGMADVRTALEMGDCGLGQMRIVTEQIFTGFREGELEAWDDYSWPAGHSSSLGEDYDGDVQMRDINGSNAPGGKVEDLSDSEDWGWEGASARDQSALDSLLDSCLAGS